MLNVKEKNSSPDSQVILTLQSHINSYLSVNRAISKKVNRAQRDSAHTHTHTHTPRERECRNPQNREHRAANRSNASWVRDASNIYQMVGPGVVLNFPLTISKCIKSLLFATRPLAYKRTPPKFSPFIFVTG